jgi:6-phosphogluconolactonase (cycloisomerase 2 family)
LPTSLRRLVAVFALLAAAIVAGPAAAHGSAGAVYALTNAPSGNAVLVYSRTGDGVLTPAGTVASGGLGDGAGLGSQGAVVIGDDGRQLFAVNPGSNSISSFSIRSRGLALVDTEFSGGTRPISVTSHDRLVYVLNGGTPNSISGFRGDERGVLKPLPGSTRPLSVADSGPAQVEFTPTGDALVVTEKATNRITTYPVDKHGFAGAPTSYASGGATPFGFAFGRHGILVVSDASGASGASSYHVARDGFVSTVTALAPTGQSAACWTVVTKNSRYAYVTNAASGNVSGFAVDRDGALSLLDPSGISAVTGGNPSDAALSENGRFLYVRVGNQGAIRAFRIGRDGSLAPLPGIAGLPATVAGLAAQ